MADSESKTLIRSLPLKDRFIILSILALVTLLSWAYLVHMAIDMDNMMAAGHMMHMMEWTTSYFIAMLLMWIIMMIGMMVPTAIPMTLVYAAVARKAATQGTSIAPTSAFVSGYVVMWGLFSVAATFAQWGLDEATLLSPMMVTTPEENISLSVLTSDVTRVTSRPTGFLSKKARLRRWRCPNTCRRMSWRTFCPSHMVR